jgi:NTE family protein
MPPKELPPTMSRHRIALVLGGGGLKGFAHLGALRALEEKGIEPAVYAGTSIGSLIAAAYVSGVSIDTLEQRALSLRRRDLFRINHLGMVLERMRNPSIYLEAPLRNLISEVVPDVKFDDLRVPLLVNTVDLKNGAVLVWGLPGLKHASVREAVYASCSLPGFFPPGIVNNYVCVDGGVIDNLPVAVAARSTPERVNGVIAIDVGSVEVDDGTDVNSQGFSGIYMRAATTMMHALQLQPLVAWRRPPMILIRPKVTRFGWFGFGHQAEMIAAGYEAAKEALVSFDECLSARSGIFPRRVLRLSVDRTKCIGCGICTALAPEIMEMDSERKAFVRTPIVDWSPADGDFVYHCPTAAIRTERVAQSVPVSEAG